MTCRIQKNVNNYINNEEFELINSNIHSILLYPKISPIKCDEKMPRELVLGNGRLTVAIDNKLNIRDFSYPQEGLENHAKGHPFRIGIWVDGAFSWIGDEWEISSRYLPDTLVSKCKASNPDLKIELKINHAVDSFLDLFMEKVIVHNLSEAKREIRVFFSHDFHIYGEESGDTAFYEPAYESIVHYKRCRYFLINGVTRNSDGIYEFSTGQKEAFGREGTWKDAEDGKLEKNPIAQGSVDSTISFKLEMQPLASDIIYYWIACGKNIKEVKDLNALVKREKIGHQLLKTEDYWSAWTNRRTIDLSILPSEISSLVKRSLLIMRSHVGDNGAIISSCDSDVIFYNKDTYAYVWPRDAAICALAFDKAGFQEVSRLFFNFCDRVISEEGYFAHKYWSDGSPGSSWHALIDETGHHQLPIQVDETSLVLSALWKHFEKYQDVEFISKVYPKLVIKTADFLRKYINSETGLPKPSFDIWEERAGTFTASAACVCSALSAAAKFAEVFYDRKRQIELNQVANKMKSAILKHLYDPSLKRFIRGFYPNGQRDTTLDSSLSYIFLSETLDAQDTKVSKTMNSLEEKLWIRTPLGGMARYENDEYYRVSKNIQGNPWIICTLWLARWQIAKAISRNDLNKPLELLGRIAKSASSTGLLAEQLNPYDGKLISVSPLSWSHAEFVIAASEYVEKFKKITV
jgi:GH15 family glucan-1,4-alpha-glucosidase